MKFLLLINSLLSNPNDDSHYMQLTGVKNPASLKGLLWTKYNHKYIYKYHQMDIHHRQCTICHMIYHKTLKASLVYKACYTQLPNALLKSSLPNLCQIGYGILEDISQFTSGVCVCT